MQRSGTTVSSRVTPAMLGDAIRAFDSTTAVVSAYLQLDRTIENASQVNQARWRDHHDRLAAEGAPEPALEAIGALVPDAHHAGFALAAIADGNGLVHVSHHESNLGMDVVSLAPLPSLLPLVRLVQSEVPHVRARIDRSAA